MKDEEILAHFDGRGRVEITLRGLDVGQGDKITAFAFELGYKLHEAIGVTRGQWRMVYLRDDSPDVRQRAQGTRDRLRTGGPIFSQPWMQAGTPPGIGRPVSPIEAAAARRNASAYETHGAKGIVVFVALLSVGCFALAWALRDTVGTFLGCLGLGVLLAAGAAFTPRLMRVWYERNRAVVTRFGQQQSSPGGHRSS